MAAVQNPPVRDERCRTGRMALPSSVGYIRAGQTFLFDLPVDLRLAIRTYFARFPATAEAVAMRITDPELSFNDLSKLTGIPSATLKQRFARFTTDLAEAIAADPELRERLGA